MASCGLSPSASWLYLKVGDHIWVMQLLQNLDLSEGAGSQGLSVLIKVLNLELLDCHCGLCAHHSALHHQACMTRSSEKKR